MPVTRPYRRTCRQFVDGSYGRGDQAKHIRHARFAEEPEHYIRAFLLLQQDLQRLFEYIEPADRNLSTYSFRTHELLLRSCVEVEANCKAILLENGYGRGSNLTMVDYKKLDATHRLSSYEVIAPVWYGTRGRRRPFENWRSGGSLPWYTAYNNTKHDRHSAFERATFEHVVDAMCGLVAVLAAQFYWHDFGPLTFLITSERPADGSEVAIGDYFRVVFPTDWPTELRYEFAWQALERESDPFQQLTF
jgi:hypothetical protein